MGEGEYGGNGSVEWKVRHGNGQSINVTGNAYADGHDNNPAAGGDFKVTIFAPASYKYNASSNTLTASVPIQHGSYTRQIWIQWPEGASAASSAMPVTSARRSVKKTKKAKKTKKTAKARKKR
jgi:hypothetical protein